MSDPKSRILARRTAFIAAAITAASCDRACGKPFACLEPPPLDAGSRIPETPPTPCLGAPPTPCLSQVYIPPDAGATIEGGANEGGVKLPPMDIHAGSDAAAPHPCLEVPATALTCLAPPPKPHVCLRR